MLHEHIEKLISGWLKTPSSCNGKNKCYTAYGFAERKNIMKYVALYANRLSRSFILFIIKMLILADIYSGCETEKREAKEGVED